MPNVRDHDSSIYFKVQGDSLSVGGYENDPVFIDQVSIQWLNTNIIKLSTILNLILLTRFQKMLHLGIQFLFWRYSLYNYLSDFFLFAFSLYELDWDVFGVHIDGAVKRCPILAQTGIKSTVCGPESFTPDHKPILG